MRTHEEFAGYLDVDGVQYPYTGSHRDWNPIPGLTPPSETVWEARAENLPFFQSGTAVLGGSKQDVLDRLSEMIRRIRDHENPQQD
jgi:hypothetical protein